jgi:hypothetical protein
LKSNRSDVAAIGKREVINAVIFQKRHYLISKAQSKVAFLGGNLLGHVFAFVYLSDLNENWSNKEITKIFC